MGEIEPGTSPLHSVCLKKEHLIPTAKIVLILTQGLFTSC